jgi:hypothetical protein
MLAVLFLPGTIIHELSHFIMAKLLFVYAGKIHLIPETVGSDVKMGTVVVGKTDILRRFLIGIAPFLYGTAIILTIIYVSIKYALTQNIWVIIGVVYIVFQIGNTMFPSKKDLEKTIILPIFIGIVFVSLYFAGVRISIEHLSTISIIMAVLHKASIYLFVPICFDSVMLLLLKSVIRK